MVRLARVVADAEEFHEETWRPLAGIMCFAFARILNSVSFAFRKPSPALETPIGGELVMMIWPPVVNACLLRMVTVTDSVDGS